LISDKYNDDGYNGLAVAAILLICGKLWDKLFA